MATMWSKAHPSWGQRRRVQRNHYAYLVAIAMTGHAGICPACLGPMSLDTAEVDKAMPEFDYTPGNVVTVCRGCNQGRSVLQSVGRDWTRVDAYIADIAKASATVAIPTEKQSMEWWRGRDTEETHPRYA